MSAPASLPLLRLLRNRNFALLWAGSTVSLIGDGIYFVAIAWEVYRLSNSPTALGIVAAAFSVPQVLLLLLGGVVSDRLDRRLLIIVGSVVSSAAIGTIGLLTELNVIAFWQIVVLVFVFGICQAFFLPASRALIPMVVPGELLAQASAVEQFIQPLAESLLGASIGGLLIATGGTGVAFLLDSLSFLVAALTVGLMSVSSVERAAAAATRRLSMLREAGQALRFIRSHPWIWAGLLAAGLANVTLTGPQQVLLPFILKYHLHGDAKDLGFVFAAGGLGAITASVYIVLRGAPRRNVTWILIAWSVGTLAVAPIGLATAPWQLMVLSFVVSCGIATGNMIWFTMLGALVPNDMLGRVSSFDYAVSFSLTPLSNGLTGPVAGALTAKITLLGAGLIAAVTTAAFLLVPGIRDPEGKLPATK